MSDPEPLGDIIDRMEIVDCAAGCGAKVLADRPHACCDACLDAHAARECPGMTLNRLQRRVVELHLIGQRRGGFPAVVARFKRVMKGRT